MSAQIRTSSEGKYVGADEVRTGPSIHDFMERTHSPMIEAKESRGEVVGSFQDNDKLVIIK